ncbi:hypothetical protein INR49_019977 [Caranx melampygus]|nr:hypothetical protein INR49_019977 [Caranx melampygus]
MMLQLCKVTSALFISNARSACSDELIQQEAVTLCINVSKQQPFPSTGVTKLQIPVYDDPNEDLYSHFDRCGDAIQKEANRGGRSVVYCKNGRSRSATICIAYLMKHRKLTLMEAVQVRQVFQFPVVPHPHVQRVKESEDGSSCDRPEPGFMSQLQRYEQELKKRRGETES